MPNAWNDDRLIDKVARDYIDRFGADALDHVECEYEHAALNDDAFYCETLADVREAIRRMVRGLAGANRTT